MVKIKSRLQIIFYNAYESKCSAVTDRSLVRVQQEEPKKQLSNCFLFMSESTLKSINKAFLGFLLFLKCIQTTLKSIRIAVRFFIKYYM